MSDCPFEALGLKPTATVGDVRGQWRRLASQHHPDRGGDAEIFHLLRSAYEKALAIAEAPKECSACQGSGRVMHISGWNQIAIVCKACGGSGKM